MNLKTNQIYHIYNRGNNRHPIFFEEENYSYFLKKVKKFLAPYCDFLAYSLMPNHFHFLIHANELTCRPYKRVKLPPERKTKPIVKMTLFSYGLKQLLSSYSKGINARYGRTGSLFQQNTKSKLTSSDSFLDDYSLCCFLYIHNNPKTAGLVEHPQDYLYSSYQEYLEEDCESICNIP